MLSSNASTYLLIVGFALAIYALLRRRSFSDPAPPRRSFSSVHARAAETRQADPPLELVRWQVEMHDTARELKAELDTKLSALQALVLIAQRESQRLEKAIRQAESLDLPEATDFLARLEQLGDPTALADPRALRDAAARVACEPAIADPFAGEQTELALANLVAQGLTAQEIASQLNLPLGEVELRRNLLAR